MNKTIKRRIADALREGLGLEGFDKTTLALGINAHFNSNLQEASFIRRIIEVRHTSVVPALTLIDAGSNRVCGVRRSADDCRCAQLTFLSQIPKWPSSSSALQSLTCIKIYVAFHRRPARAKSAFQTTPA